MRIGTAAVVAGFGIALAGCGGTDVHQQAARDTLVPAAQPIAGPIAVPVGPHSNPHAVAADPVAPKADDEVVPQPPALPNCPAGPDVHFDTPQAAMTYLAAAWNRNDLAALCQVTNPNSRFLLNDMHREAVNLRLKSCTRMDVGLYECTFAHDYPRHLHAKGTGRTWLQVAAADNPGWYLLDYVGCG